MSHRKIYNAMKDPISSEYGKDIDVFKNFARDLFAVKEVPGAYNFEIKDEPTEFDKMLDEMFGEQPQRNKRNSQNFLAPKLPSIERMYYEATGEALEMLDDKWPIVIRPSFK